MTPDHEQLSSGIANLTGGTDDDFEVRIVPITEGEVTTGQSGKRTIWDREPMREAVEAGLLNGSTIVKGEGGKNPHFPMDEQVPPENILGRVDEWTYEEGAGPVGYAQLADEGIAKRVDLGLLDVSADLERVLGEYDEERDGHPVEQLVGMPRVTILEQGAAANASIEPATAEALGVHPDDLGPGGDTEQLAGLQTLRFRAYGDMIGQEFVDDAVSSVDSIAGLSAVASATSDSPELLVVIDTKAVDSLDTLNEQLIEALDETPFEVYEDFDWLEEIQYEHLAGEIGGDDDPSASETPTPTGGSQASDEPADTGTGDIPSDMTDDKIQELQEQLAAAKQENETLREEKESLESETDELESELSEKEQTIDDLEDENQSFGRVLAARVAGDSPLDADSLAERYTVEELADTVVKHEGLADEEARSNDDYDPIAQVQEQLAQAPAHRGQAPEGDEGGNLTEEQLAAADDLATSVLTMDDVQRVQSEQLSPREYVQREHDVDPAQYEDEQALRSAIAANGGEA